MRANVDLGWLAVACLFLAFTCVRQPRALHLQAVMTTALAARVSLRSNPTPQHTSAPCHARTGRVSPHGLTGAHFTSGYCCTPDTGSPFCRLTHRSRPCAMHLCTQVPTPRIPSLTSGAPGVSAVLETAQTRVHGIGVCPFGVSMPRLGRAAPPSTF